MGDLLSQKIRIARYSSGKIIYRKLYPAVSHDEGACTVKVNFGEEDFVWPGAKNQKGIRYGTA